MPRLGVSEAYYHTEKQSLNHIFLTWSHRSEMGVGKRDVSMCSVRKSLPWNRIHNFKLICILLRRCSLISIRFLKKCVIHQNLQLESHRHLIQAFWDTRAPKSSFPPSPALSSSICLDSSWAIDYPLYSCVCQPPRGPDCWAMLYHPHGHIQGAPQKLSPPTFSPGFLETRVLISKMLSALFLFSERLLHPLAPGPTVPWGPHFPVAP